LESKLIDISDPLSDNYGKHLSREEISALTGNPVSVQEINKYLQYKGIKVTQFSHNNQYITAKGNHEVVLKIVFP
jgi:hypothetical protein